jgi:hypothetical protein
METRSGSITITIGQRWWKMSVVGGESAPWLIWRSGHLLPGQYNKSGFRIDIGSTGTCLPDRQAGLPDRQTCLQEVYVRENVRKTNVKSRNQ